MKKDLLLILSAFLLMNMQTACSSESDEDKGIETPGDFETVGYIGFSLPANNTNITTQAGDVILYQGSQICIFYGSNSWSYTRIGRITNASQQELRTLLSSGEVNIMLSLNGNNGGIMGETVVRF